MTPPTTDDVAEARRLLAQMKDIRGAKYWKARDRLEFTLLDAGGLARLLAMIEDRDKEINRLRKLVDDACNLSELAATHAEAAERTAADKTAEVERLREQINVVLHHCQADGALDRGLICDALTPPDEFTIPSGGGRIISEARASLPSTGEG